MIPTLNSGFEIPLLGLGTYGMAGAAGAAAMAAAISAGYRPAQVVLPWAVQQGIAVIPKSARPERQQANLQIFGFSLSDAEMTVLAALDRGEGAAVDSDARVEF